MLSLDAHLSQNGVNIVRGGAKDAQPKSDGLRQKIRLFKKIQAGREHALEALGKEVGDSMDKEAGNGDDMPARTDLGGLQGFTPGRENGSGKDKDSHKRPKGYADYRPQKKTVRLIMQVKEILEEYQDYLPMTARQVFYRLVGAYGYPKTENKYDSLCDVLVRARRAKQIPFDHIRDDGISIMAYEHYDDENHFYKRIHDMGKNFTLNKLAHQKMDVRAYCEASGMIPQLSRVCKEYSIPVYSCSGFDSLSGKYELKQACNEAFTYWGRPTVILHLGDYDPSGESIFNDGLVEA
jgi:hypothetical protein